MDFYSLIYKPFFCFFALFRSYPRYLVGGLSFYQFAFDYSGRVAFSFAHSIFAFSSILLASYTFVTPSLSDPFLKKPLRYGSSMPPIVEFWDGLIDYH